MSNRNHRQLRKFVVDDRLFYYKVETSYRITLYNDKKQILQRELGIYVDPANLKTLETYIRNNLKPDIN